MTDSEMMSAPFQRNARPTESSCRICDRIEATRATKQTGPTRVPPPSTMRLPSVLHHIRPGLNTSYRPQMSNDTYTSPLATRNASPEMLRL